MAQTTARPSGTTRKALDIAAAAKEEFDERRAAARDEARGIVGVEEIPEVVDEVTGPADDAEVAVEAELAPVLEMVDVEAVPADDAGSPRDSKATVEIESAEASDEAKENVEEGEGD